MYLALARRVASVEAEGGRDEAERQRKEVNGPRQRQEGRTEAVAPVRAIAVTGCNKLQLDAQ